jgi:hypothetical protein
MKRNKQFQGSKRKGREAAREERLFKKDQESATLKVLERIGEGLDIEDAAKILGIRLK